MTSDKEPRLPLMEAGLLQACQALDHQVAREMQRSPEQIAQHGVQKWTAYQSRVEKVATFLIDSIGQGDIDLGSLLIISQATAKALQILAEELSEEDLGVLRSKYATSAIDQLLQSLDRARRRLSHESDLQ